MYLHQYWSRYSLNSLLLTNYCTVGTTPLPDWRFAWYHTPVRRTAVCTVCTISPLIACRSQNVRLHATRRIGRQALASPIFRLHPDSHNLRNCAMTTNTPISAAAQGRRQGMITNLTAVTSRLLIGRTRDKSH